MPKPALEVLGAAPPAAESPVSKREASCVRRWLHSKPDGTPRSRNTADAYKRALRAFLSATGACSIADACSSRDKGELALKWYATMLHGYAARTQHQRLSAIRGLVKLCEQDGVIPEPCSHTLELPEVDWSAPEFDAMPTPEQVKAAFDSLECDRDRALFAFVYATACRTSEAAALLWADVRRTAKGTLIVKLHGKGRKDRKVEIEDPRVVALLHSLDRTSALVFPMHRSTIYRVWRKAWGAAGVGELSCGRGGHLARHAKITQERLANPEDRERLRLLAGHKDLGTIDGYGATAPASTGSLALPW